MAETNWNDVYKGYVTQYKDPFKAAEYTVFGRLTGSKKVPTTYSQEQWYEYEAPDYWRAVSYTGDDALAKYTRDALKGAKSFDQLISIAKGANSGTNKLLSAEYGVVDYYSDLKELWKQRTSAEKKASSSSSKWWTQYGLPDPSLRFEANSTDETKLFSPAEDYIEKQTKAYEAKKGTAAAKDFNKALRTAIYKKLNDAGVTPFLVQAQQRIKARG